MALLRLLALAGVVLTVAVRAGCMEEEVGVAAQVDRDAIAVGDTFRLDIAITWPQGVSVKPLALGEQVGSFAVRDINYGPVSAQDTLSTRTISLLLTTFKTGKQTVPPLSVVYMDRAGDAGRVETGAVDIEVASVLPQDASEIKDIKAPIEVPKRWRDIIASWALLVGLCAVAATSVLVSVKRRDELEGALRRIWLKITSPLLRFVRWLLRRLSLIGQDEFGAPAFDAAVAEPYLTPEQAALREFDRIDAMRLAEEGRAEELNTLVSEVVRRYLERRFRILAMESPTSYTLAALRGKGISSETLDLAEEILDETDLVKFASVKPAGEAAKTLTDRGRRFVERSAAEMGVGAAVEVCTR
jgi:hypothetical protein